MFSKKIINTVHKRFSHSHNPITSYPKFFESKNLVEIQIGTNNQILKKLEEIQNENQKLDSHNYLILKMLKDLTDKNTKEKEKEKEKDKKKRFINPIVDDLDCYKKCNSNKDSTNFFP
jgi:hypothetical protein